MNYIDIALVLVFAAVVLLLISYAYARAEISRLAHYRYWSDRFYSASKQLLDLPDVPGPILKIIEDINDVMRARWVAFAIMNVFARRLKEAPKTSPARSEDYAEFEKFCLANPKVGKARLELMEKAVNSGLMALTYTSLVWGLPARAMLADVFAKQERGPTSAAEIHEVSNQVRDSHFFPNFGFYRQAA